MKIQPLPAIPPQLGLASALASAALASAARLLCGEKLWRLAMPQVLEELSRASGAARGAWFELDDVAGYLSKLLPGDSAPQWSARLRDEWLAPTGSSKDSFGAGLLSHAFERELRSSDPCASRLAWGRAEIFVPNEAGDCFCSLPILLQPVLVRGRLRGVLLVQGEECEERNEAWRGLACLLADALEREDGDSQRSSVEAARGRSEHLLRALLDTTGSITCAIEPGGTIFYASPSLEHALGAHGTGSGEACLWDLVHPDDRDLVRLRIRQAVQSAQAAQVLAEPQAQDSSDALESGETWEMRLEQQDGSWRTFEVSCRSLLHDPLIRGLILNGRDVSSQRAIEASLLRAAMHDRLTGLPNRTLFMDRLRLRVEKSKRERYKPPPRDHRDGSISEANSQTSQASGEEMFAVLFLDFDRFKVINDSLGHMVGDELLKGIARRLETCLRPGDTVARLAGDEFAILLHEIGSQVDAIQVVERIQKSLSASFLLLREEKRHSDGAAQSSTHEVFISASVGIALGGSEPHATPYENEADALRDADMAMYRAKAKGRARHEIFNARMHEQAVERLQLETDLRRSLENGDFRVHYQPIIALESGLLSGFEALVRWHHPKRGLVAPEGFLAVAEETGLLVPLGWWVLRHACAQLRAWMNQMSWEGEPPLHDLSINVNLCVSQFASDELPERVRQVLADLNLRPRNLKLEITESTLIAQSNVAARQLQELHEIGVQIGLDDFGTGYSSLAYLHRFPIDSLKIDRSFIARLGLDGADAEPNASIVSTILSLARQMNLDVVAEGVETLEQAGKLREMHCPMGQGFFFSQPMPHEAAAIFMGASAIGPILES